MLDSVHALTPGGVSGIQIGVPMTRTEGEFGTIGSLLTQAVRTRIVVRTMMNFDSDDVKALRESMRRKAIKELRYIYESIYMNSKHPITTINHGSGETTKYTHRD